MGSPVWDILLLSCIAWLGRRLATGGAEGKAKHQDGVGVFGFDAVTRWV